VPRQTIYYWGDYSNTLYHDKKDATPESAEKHLASLVDIIEISEKEGLKPPPGICCEYGFLMYQMGNSDLALEYFNKEKSLYQESAIFVDFLMGEMLKANTEEVTNEES
jgi:hypothetical protein